MKKILLFVAMAALLLACKRSAVSKDAGERSSIVGKWRFSAYLADPGDGSGKWQEADPWKPSYIEFRLDGTLSYTPANPNDPSRYQLGNDSTIIFFRATDNIKVFYRIQTAVLTIYPPCIEACGERYVAVP